MWAIAARSIGLKLLKWAGIDLLATGAWEYFVSGTATSQLPAAIGADVRTQASVIRGTADVARETVRAVIPASAAQPTAASLPPTAPNPPPSSSTKPVAAPPTQAPSQPVNQPSTPAPSLAALQQAVARADRGNNYEANVVTEIQKTLKQSGYDIGTFGPNGDGIDGKFGAFTQAGLKGYLTKAGGLEAEKMVTAISAVTFRSARGYDNMAVVTTLTMSADMPQRLTGAPAAGSERRGPPYASIPTPLTQQSAPPVLYNPSVVL